MPEQTLSIRPYLSIAVFCEKVLKETDGVLSAIRIIDRFTIPGTTEQMPASTVAFTPLITFKSGEFRGRAEIELRANTPSNSRLPSIKFPINFEGDDDRGVGVAVQTQLRVDEEGTYWWDVLLTVAGGETELITRIPLRILYRRVQSLGEA